MSQRNQPRPSITLDPDSFECPRCGAIGVPNDDRLGRPIDAHECPAADAGVRRRPDGEGER